MVTRACLSRDAMLVMISAGAAAWHRVREQELSVMATKKYTAAASAVKGKAMDVYTHAETTLTCAPACAPLMCAS